MLVVVALENRQVYMTSRKPVLDVDGVCLQEGDATILLDVSAELLSGLPSEDQSAIKEQVGKALLVQGFDDHGNVELEFKSEDETIHFIWVAPSCLRKLT